VRATYSAHGANSFPQTGAVSLSLAANVPMRRQLPFRSSKKSDRRIGSRIIQSNNQASTDGRTGSMMSKARLSRFRVSTRQLSNSIPRCAIRGWSDCGAVRVEARSCPQNFDANERKWRFGAACLMWSTIFGETRHSYCCRERMAILATRVLPICPTHASSHRSLMLTP
jgi:hypothetical protein